MKAKQRGEAKEDQDEWGAWEHRRDWCQRCSLLRILERAADKFAMKQLSDMPEEKCLCASATCCRRVFLPSHLCSSHFVKSVDPFNPTQVRMLQKICARVLGSWVASCDWWRVGHVVHWP